jgi:hypothetical protein
MKFLSSVAVAILAASQALAQSLTINTPTNPTTCIPLLITWVGGTPPYFLTLVPANQPGATPIINFGQQNSTSLTWRVNVAAGTSVNFNLVDNTGLTAQTAPFSIIAGSDTTCVGQNISTTAGPTVPIPTGATNTPAPTTGGGATTGGQTTRPTTGASTGTTSAPANTPTGAAAHLVGPVGAAGAFAIAVIAALV